MKQRDSAADDQIAMTLLLAAAVMAPGERLLLWLIPKVPSNWIEATFFWPLRQDWSSAELPHRGLLLFAGLLLLIHQVRWKEKKTTRNFP